MFSRLVTSTANKPLNSTDAEPALRTTVAVAPTLYPPTPLPPKAPFSQQPEHPGQKKEIWAALKFKTGVQCVVEERSKEAGNRAERGVKERRENDSGEMGIL